MTVTILGRGFGLYGYLPALVARGIPVILPTCYQETILARQDLHSYYDAIQWGTDHASILQECEGVVMALPPAEQYVMVKKCLAYNNIMCFFLEKPLATSPILAADLLDLLVSSGKKFRLGFNFRYTDWGKKLLSQDRGASHISWNFCAHHYVKKVQTWKRYHSEGGGALRFYGIHLIALLAEMGYDDVCFSAVRGKQPDDAAEWVAELAGPKLENCHIYVSSHCEETSFKTQSSEYHCDLSQPFQRAEHSPFLDQRVPFLMEGVLDLFQNNERYYPWYQKANNLWQKIEEFR